MEVNLIFRKVVRLDNVNFLLYLLHHLLYRILISPGRNCIFMYAFNRRRGYIQAFNIYLPTGKYSRHLIQQSGDILRMNDDGI